MQMQSDIIKLLNISLEDNTYIGKGFMKEPDIGLKTEADDNSYIGLEQVVGLNPMTSELTLSEFSPETLKLFGICGGNRKRLIGRGSFDTGNCEPTSYKITLEGLLTDLPGATLKPGKFDRGAFKFGSINYYRLEIGGKTIIEIDRTNHKVVVDGFDQMAAHRRNAGL
jgi:P2 family phage contractile tail tube protein